AADERHLLRPSEWLQRGPGLVHRFVARTTERAADNVEEAPDALAPDVLGDRFKLCLEDEAGNACSGVGDGVGHALRPRSASWQRVGGFRRSCQAWLAGKRP